VTFSSLLTLYCQHKASQLVLGYHWGCLQ